MLHIACFGGINADISREFRNMYSIFSPLDGAGGGLPTEGLVDAEYEASVATLESIAATLNAKCVLLREKQLDDSGK